MVPIHVTKRTNTTGNQWGVNPLTSIKMTEKGPVLPAAIK